MTNGDFSQIEISFAPIPLEQLSRLQNEAIKEWLHIK